MTDSEDFGKNLDKTGDAFTEGSRRPRGRPKNIGLRDRILECAVDLFLEHGYQAVAMDAIAQAAQVSNRTVYSHFENKERLLAAVFHHVAERLRPHFSEKKTTTEAEFKVALASFGEQLVGLLTHPAILGLGRVMIEEARRHPEMTKSFYEWGPMQTERQLVDFMELGRKNKWIQTEDTRLAACQLIALWQGTWHLKQQLGLTSKLSPQKIKRHVAESLSLFFLAVGAR